VTEGASTLGGSQMEEGERRGKENVKVKGRALTLSASTAWGGSTTVVRTVDVV